MRLKIQFYVLSCLILLLVEGCSSARKIEKPSPAVRYSAEIYAKKLLEYEPTWPAISGKAALFFEVDGGKGKKVTANVRIERGEMIRFSVAPLLGVEVMRMEISPEGLLLLDRLHKQYVQVSFEELEDLLQVHLDYQTFQALFLNEIFFPGKSNLQTSDIDEFHVKEENQGLWLETDAAKDMDFSFLISAGSGLLERCCIGMKKTSRFFICDYGTFEKFAGRLFPRRLSLLTEGGHNVLRFDLQYSRLSVTEAIGERTTIPSRYAKIGLYDLLKMVER